MGCPPQRPGQGDGPLEQAQAMLTGLSAALAHDRALTDKVLSNGRTAIARSVELVATCRQGMPDFADPSLPPEDQAGGR